MCMVLGRACYLGGDADVGEELPLLGVELVVRGALAPQPVSGAIVEVIEAVLRVQGMAGLDVVAGAVVAALPCQVPGRVPPGIDDREGLCPGGG